MPREPVVDRIIGDIADGAPVDWNGLESEIQSDDERSWAKALRLLHDVANVHRSGGSASEEPATTDATVDAETTTKSGEQNPRAWGRYHLEDSVGEGSFGRVYRAWDPELERHIALKVLHAQVSDSRTKERLLKEGRALARIRHPNVVNVLGVETHGEQVALCMEFIRGETLANVVHKYGTLSARETVIIGEDLCRALSAVHKAGFIHRDVKARNVMREDAGRIVLMDFGTGRKSERPSWRGDLAGTPVYMAPEVLEGGEASARSDVYSLGVLLYHLVTAAYPVEGHTIDEVHEAHRERRRHLLSERRPDLPVAFVRVIEKAIAAEPAERYTSPGELLQALGTLDLAESMRTRRLRNWAIGAGVVIVGMMLIGAITSAIYNILLWRRGFVEETPLDWLMWGRLSSLPPFLIFLMVLLGATVIVNLRRLVLAASPRARTADANLRHRATRTARRLRLDDVSVLASYTLLLTTVALAAAWLYFSPLISALFEYPATASAETLRLLSPEFKTFHNFYRGVFSFVVMFSVAAWYPVWKLARKGHVPHRALVAGGAVVTCVAVALLHVPYRMLLYRDSHRTVNWNDADCYVLGERQDELLLFCPELTVPRIRPVPKTETTALSSGVAESIFTRFGRAETTPPD